MPLDSRRFPAPCHPRRPFCQDSWEALHRDEGGEADAFVGTVRRVVADDEAVAEVFEKDSFDLVTSVMSLGWANDLPGCFIQASCASAEAEVPEEA